jgi:hypothetical protein
MLFEVNNKPAVKIFAKQLKVTEKSILFNCEGDQHWLPKSCIRIVDKDSILIQEWLFNKNFKK